MSCLAPAPSRRAIPTNQLQACLWTWSTAPSCCCWRCGGMWGTCWSRTASTTRCGTPCGALGGPPAPPAPPGCTHGWLPHSQLAGSVWPPLPARGSQPPRALADPGARPPAAAAAAALGAERRVPKTPALYKYMLAVARREPHSTDRLIDVSAGGAVRSGCAALRWPERPRFAVSRALRRRQLLPRSAPPPPPLAAVHAHHVRPRPLRPRAGDETGCIPPAASAAAGDGAAGGAAAAAAARAMRFVCRGRQRVLLARCDPTSAD